MAVGYTITVSRFKRRDTESRLQKKETLLIGDD